MATTFSKAPLSGGAHGVGVKVAAVAIGSGTTIHQAVNSTSDIDLVTLFGFNSDTVDRILTLGWGGTTDPDNLIKYELAPQSGLVLLVADQPLRNNLIVYAAGDSANKIILYGYVNEIRTV